MGEFSTANLKFLWRGNNLTRGENPRRSPLQAFGTAVINSSDTQALDGRSVTLGGTLNDYVQVTDAVGDISNKDFYLYFRGALWGNSLLFLQALFGLAPRSGQQSYYLYASADRTSVGFWSSTNGTGGDGSVISGSVDMTDGAPRTIEVSRENGILRLFIEGILVASQSRPVFYSRPDDFCMVGRIGVAGYEYPAKVTVDEIALVVGEAVETADHAVRTTPFPAPDAAKAFELTPSAVIRGPERPPVASRVSPGLHHLDMEHGGRYRIASTVKAKGSPANIPLHRRVQLIRERGSLVIRETWSDPVTGDYVFDNISGDYTYTVVAYDYTHNYRAVIADNLTPELMP